jgi:hypothetical protein
MLPLNLGAVLSSWHLPKDRKLHKLRKKYKLNPMAALQFVIYNAVLVQSPWFEGLWSQAREPVEDSFYVLKILMNNLG